MSECLCAGKGRKGACRGHTAQTWGLPALHRACGPCPMDCAQSLVQWPQVPLAPVRSQPELCRGPTPAIPVPGKISSRTRFFPWPGCPAVLGKKEGGSELRRVCVLGCGLHPKRSTPVGSTDPGDSATMPAQELAAGATAWCTPTRAALASPPRTAELQPPGPRSCAHFGLLASSCPAGTAPSCSLLSPQPRGAPHMGHPSPRVLVFHRGCCGPSGQATSHPIPLGSLEARWDLMQLVKGAGLRYPPCLSVSRSAGVQGPGGDICEPQVAYILSSWERDLPAWGWPLGRGPAVLSSL